jgi:glycosyltransferase involved in cell wall biosynthesis
MKLAILGLRGIPAKSGGIENHVEHLAPLLAKAGHEVTVYCRSHYSKDRKKSFRGVKLVYLPSINTKHTESLTHSFLSTLSILPKKYDIVHYHAMANGLFAAFPRIAGKKTIVTLHGLDYEREKWGRLAKAYLKLSEKAVTRFPNRIISVSEKIQRHFKAKYNKDIAYIPNGVDTAKTRKLSQLRRFKLKPNYILFMGRIVPEKGLHTLIAAFKQVKTNSNLVIAGDATHTESYEKEIKQLAKDDKRIVFTGPLYGKDKEEALSNCLFFVLPSTIEGMPIVLLEAMSYGICPLASDIEENSDALKGHGFLFKNKDAKSLKHMLIQMLNNKDLIQAEGRRCKAFVKKEYDWKKIAKQTIAVYKEALNGKAA